MSRHRYIKYIFLNICIEENLLDRGISFVFQANLDAVRHPECISRHVYMSSVPIVQVPFESWLLLSLN